MSASTTGNPEMRRRHQRLDAVAAADLQRHDGAELAAGIFLLDLHGAGDVAAVGEALLADQRRPHVRDDRHPIVVGEIERRHQLDPVPLGIEPAHVEEPEIRAAAAAGAEDPRPDRQASMSSECDRGAAHAHRRHCEERSDEAISREAALSGTRLLRCARNDNREEAARAAIGDPGRRSDAHSGRAVLHDDAGRHGRRGDQGGAARAPATRCARRASSRTGSPGISPASTATSARCRSTCAATRARRCWRG